MRSIIFRGLLTLSVALFLCSGCAKEALKPEEGMADKAPAPVPQPAQQTQKQAEAPPAAMNAEQVREVVAKDDAAAGMSSQSQSGDKTAGQITAAEFKTGLATILFEFDSYALTQPSRDILTSNANYLLKKYRGKVILEGHCDERGSDEYNLALGENRAKSVMNYLLTMGVPAEQLSIVSYGKERPVDNGHSEEAWAKNRRVEFEPAK